MEKYCWKEREITWQDFAGGFAASITLLVMILGVFTVVYGNLNTSYSRGTPIQMDSATASISPEYSIPQYEYLGDGGIGYRYEWGWDNYSYGQFVVTGKIYSVSGENNPQVVFKISTYFGGPATNGSYNPGSDIYAINETNGYPSVYRSFDPVFTTIFYTNNVEITVVISTEPSFSAHITSNFGNLNWKNVLNTLNWTFFGGN